MNEQLPFRKILCRAAALFVACVLLLPAAQAKDNPIYIEYTGTDVSTLMPVPWGDPFPPGMINADAKGSFGPSAVAILSKWFPVPRDGFDPCSNETDALFLIEYARGVVSFEDGSQLYATVESGDVSWMCLSGDGSFTGSVHGYFIDGTGRFMDAEGEFDSPFSGQNLTNAFLGEFPFRSITGWIDGTVRWD